MKTRAASPRHLDVSFQRNKCNLAANLRWISNIIIISPSPSLLLNWPTTKKSSTRQYWRGDSDSLGQEKRV